MCRTDPPRFTSSNEVSSGSPLLEKVPPPVSATKSLGEVSMQIASFPATGHKSVGAADADTDMIALVVSVASMLSKSSLVRDIKQQPPVHPEKRLGCSFA